MPESTPKGDAFKALDRATTLASASPEPDRALLFVSLFLLSLMVLARFPVIEALYDSSQHDLRAYIAAAHNIVNGRHLYQTHHSLIPEDTTLTADVPEYLYPPLLGILMIPSTVLPYETFKHVWFFLNLFFVFHGVYLAVSLLPAGREKVPILLFCSAVALGMESLAWLLRTAQVDAFVIYLVLLAMSLFQRKQWLASAFLISAASWCKVTPGLLFLFLLTRGNGRFALLAIGSGIALLLVQLVVVGDELVYFFTDTLGSGVPGRFGAPEMQSLWSITRTMFVSHRDTSQLDSIRHFNAALVVLKGFVLICTAAVMLRRGESRQAEYFAFAVCCAATLLITDMAWIMRFVWNIVLLVGIVFAAVSAVKGREFFIVGAVAMISIVLNFQFVLDIAFEPDTNFRQFLLAGPGMSALLCLAVLTVLATARSRWIQPIEVTLARMSVSRQPSLDRLGR